MAGYEPYNEMVTSHASERFVGFPLHTLNKVRGLEIQERDFPRVPWEEDLWNGIRRECQSVTKLPKAGTDERFWIDSRPTKTMLLEMVSILDGLDRLVSLAEKETLESNPTLNNWLISIRGLQRRMVRSLEKIGVKPIPSLGRPFDPNLHEVIEVRKDPSLPPATVVEVKEKPYRWGKRVLRVGKVVVTPKTETP